MLWRGVFRVKIIPAIDLIDGQNVRLSQGDYKKQSQMKKTPQQALEFYSGYQSVERIHVVDLMGALHKKAVESNLVSELAEQSALPLEIGGGIRSLETLKAYHDMGVEYFILGTRAIIDVPWLKEAARSEEHTSELQSRFDLVCPRLLEKKNNIHCITV